MVSRLPGRLPTNRGTVRAAGPRGCRLEGGRVLQEIAVAHRATPAQVALRFPLRHLSRFAIPESSSPEHAAENAGAGDLRLSEAELARIDEAIPRGPGRVRFPCCRRM